MKTCRLLAALCVLVLAAAPASAQSVAGYSEYYIPVDETSLQIAFTNLDGPTTDTLMHTVITVTTWSSATTVYYDHWENGYGFDPNNPASADETYTLATVGAQQVFESSNIPTNPRGTATFYDGGDRIFVAGGTATVTRASWLEARGAGNQAAAWEIYPVKPQLTTYVIPFGENLGFTPFLRFYTMIQATDDNTTFTVDLNGDGTADPLNQNRDGDRTDPGDIATVTLSRGQSFLLDRVSACPGGAATCSQANGNILAGTVIQGNKTLQVKFVAGNPAQNYCARGFSAFPRGFWTRDYYAPLDQPAGTPDTDYYLHNPHTTPLTVSWQTRVGSGSFSIPANGTVSYRTASGLDMPVDSGIYFSAADDFWGVGAGDSVGAAYEWGFSLLPTTFLYREHFMGWAPGSVPTGTGGSADNVGVFLTPAQDNTQVFVDFDNDGVADQTFTLNRLQTQYVFDPTDGDLSRAHFWATGDFTLSYGENPDTAPTSNPSIDLGYVGLPGSDFVQAVLEVDKSASPQVVPTAAGSVATFTIVASTFDYTISTLSITDLLPPNWQFVNGSATITLPDQTTVSGGSANPSISGSSLTWNAAFGGLMGMAENQTTRIVFQASTTAVLPAGTLSRNDVSAVGERIFYPGTPQQITQTFSSSDFAFVASGALQIAKASSAPTPLFPGDTFTYTVTVTNPAGSPTQTGVSVYDGIPVGLSYVAGSGSVTCEVARNVRDEFTTAAYTNNNGNVNWAGAWTETDSVGGGATGGLVQVTGGVLRFQATPVTGTATDDFSSGGYAGGTGWVGAWTETGDDGTAGGGTIGVDGDNRIEFRAGTGTDDSAQRSVTVTGATSISGSVFFQRNGGLDVADNLIVEYSANGGGSFTTLLTLNGGSADDTTFNWGPIVWNPVDTTFLFRIRSADGIEGGEEARFDAINISFSGGAVAAAGAAARRSADLSAATSATLSFAFTAANLVAGDTVVVEASADGAAFTVLETFNGATGASTRSYDLVSPVDYATLNTAIRFRVTNGFGTTAKTFSVDNVDISYTVSSTFASANPPAFLTSTAGCVLRGGSSLTLTFGARVDNPFPTGQSSVTNTATVTTSQLPVQLSASITNQVEVPSAQSASVAGRVWQDADGDAVQDLGEPGIANVEVTLKDQFGTPVATAFTDSNGRYLFTGVSPGTGYYVEATAPPDPAGDPLIGLTQSAPVGRSDYRTDAFDLSAGENYTGADQGYRPAAGTAAFGDLAWVDANANGLRDLGEVGLGGVAVRLYRDNGNGLLNTLLDTFVPNTTPEPGTLAVTNGSAAVVGTGTSFLALGAGDPITIAGVQYTILSVASATSLTLTTNYTGTTGAGRSAVVVSTAGTGTVAATSGSPTVTGTGTTFTNLAQGDPFVINGVKYKVQSVTNDTTLTLTTNYAAATASGLTYGIPALETTAPDGSYLFTGVAPVGQTYFVASSLPSGYTRTTSQAFTFPSVAGGTSYLIADFGYNSIAPTFSITDRVWNDTNADGVFGGGEVGIAGVTIELLDASLNVIGTTITGANGTFSFSGLAGAGADYTTRISDTSGVLIDFFGTTPYALAGQRLEANLVASIDRSAAPSYGFSLTRSVGDTVYNDVNGNGSHDGGEPGIAGVVASLYKDVDGDGVVDVALGAGTVTATNGSATVTGAGGTIFTAYHAGEPFLIQGVAYTILSVTSNTSLTLTTNYAETTGAGKAYSAPPQGAGTVSVTNGSATVTGTGTTFTRFRAGELITINNGGTTWVTYTIQSIASDTSLTLSANYAGTTNATRGYYGPGDALLGSVTTDAAGQYLFSGLSARGYVASVSTPAGYTYINGVSPVRVDTDGTFPGIQLAATIVGSASVLDRDFGFQATTQRTISGTIWNDIDANGVIGGAELRLSGVTVDIIDSNNVVVQTLTTDGSGNYSAVGLPAATYTVRVTDTLGVLTGYSATFERTEGTTAPFNGQESVNVVAVNVTNVHFGFRRPQPTHASISRFTATSTGSGVLVEWRTSSEVGTLGFYLYRLDPKGVRWRQVNNRMLPGLIDSPQGGVYRYLDEAAQPGGEITYVLREIEPLRWLDHGPYRVTPAANSGASPMTGKFDAQRLRASAKTQRRLRQASDEKAAHRLGIKADAPARAAAGRARGGARAKLAVRERGLYTLDKDTIAGLLGVTPDQAVDLVRAGQLKLGNKGTDVAWFPSGDALRFYGEPIDSLYTLDNIYWLGAKPGRILREANGGNPAPVDDPLTFGDDVHFEQDRFAATLVAQDPASDYWPWEYVIAGDPGVGARSFDLPIDGATSDAGTLSVSLLGATDTAAVEDHHVVVRLNGTELGEARWDGLGALRPSFDIPSGVLQDGANSVEIRGVLDSGAPFSIFYVDSFDVSCRRLYRASGNRLLLRAEERRTLTVSGFDSDQIDVVDVTNPRAIRRVSGVTIDQVGSFRASFAGVPGSAYLAVAAPALAHPEGWTDAPSNLGQSGGAQHLIIAPGSLVETARALAEYRSGRGLTSFVADLEDIYDDFNHGIASPEAVRSFLSQAAGERSRRQGPKYALLVGNGNVDYRNLLGHDDNLMPPLMAPTPFGLFAADNRFAPVSRNGVPRLAIGRLPVLTAAELEAQIQKIQAYEGAGSGPWQRRVHMVADNFDPTAGDFTSESEAVAGLIPAGFDVTRSYLDFETPSDARADLLGTLDAGALLVNYVGHGGLDRLAGESLLMTQDVPGLQASSGPPVFAALTCAVGRFDVPGVTPLASALVLDPDGGAIAAWAPTGLSFSSEANVLNQGFARALFDGSGQPLGQAVRSALRDYIRPGFQPFMLDIYNLLGDPALEVQVP